jgi:hypothetical protein
MLSFKERDQQSTVEWFISVLKTFLGLFLVDNSENNPACRELHPTCRERERDNNLEYRNCTKFIDVLCCGCGSVYCTLHYCMYNP